MLPLYSIHSLTFTEDALCSNGSGRTKGCPALGAWVIRHSFWTQADELFELFQIAGGD